MIVRATSLNALIEIIHLKNGLTRTHNIPVQGNVINREMGCMGTSNPVRDEAGNHWSSTCIKDPAIQLNK